MAIRTDAEARQTYLVEHYRPGYAVEALREWAVRVRETVAEMQSEGKAVRYVRSTIVPADESLLCELEAGCEDLVRETLSRAGVPFERLSTALPDEVDASSHGHPPAPAVQEGSHLNAREEQDNDR